MREVVRDWARAERAAAPRASAPPPPIPSDDVAQNLLLPPAVRGMIEGGLDCDILPGAVGELGRTWTNPIPTNGVLGSVLYLSSLRTAADQPLLFHRLGSRGKVDVYETVSLDGESWDVLFVDMYHPRKSRRAPSGLTITTLPVSCATGTTLWVKRFPADIADAIRQCSLELLGYPYAISDIEAALRARRRWSAPKEHVREVREVQRGLGARATR